MRGRIIRWTLPFILLAAAGSGAVVAMAGSSKSSSGTVDVGKTATLGTVLVAADGHTLYRYTVDSKGINRCSSVAACNAYWPALTVKGTIKPTAGAGASSKLLGTIAAAHGMRQITYAGYPLYFFSGDKKAGQTNGQGFESKWYVVGTTGGLVKHAITATASTQSASTTTTTGGGSSYPAATTSPGGANTGQNADGCPAGTTIPQNGGGDNDSDNSGDTSDGDGCL